MTHDAIYEYLMSSRGVGHTTLLKEGAKNFDKPFYIVAHNSRYAKQLQRESNNNNAIPISLNSPTQLMRGTKYPIIIDNVTYMTTCDKYENIILDNQNKYFEMKVDLETELWCEEQKHLKIQSGLHSKLSKQWFEIKSYKEKNIERNLKLIDLQETNHNMVDRLVNISFWDRLFNYKTKINEQRR
jgi:hypothetical protein